MNRVDIEIIRKIRSKDINWFPIGMTLYMDKHDESEEIIEKAQGVDKFGETLKVISTVEQRIQELEDIQM